MKNRKLETLIRYSIILSCFVVVLLTLAMLEQATAQVMFFADFEPNSTKAIPNKTVNDVANWKPENPAQQWAISDFANGTKGLRQIVEGCDKSGNTPLPGVTNFTDGIIQLEMSWGDDDSWGVVLRKTADNKGYLVVFGYIETPAVIIALLDKGCTTVGMCLDQTTCENNPANTLVQKDHGLAPTDKENKVVYFGRIEARGDTIKVWYKARNDVKDPNAKDLGAPLVEIKDSTHKGGSVGIWHESNNNGTIDNVLVTGPEGIVAVESQAKLVTCWGFIKTNY